MCHSSGASMATSVQVSLRVPHPDVVRRAVPRWATRSGTASLSGTRDRRRQVRNCELCVAARRRFQLDQDLAKELSTRVDRRLSGARRHEQDGAGLNGDLDAAGPFNLRVDSRALNDAHQVWKIMAMAVGTLTRGEVPLPHTHEFVLE